MFDPFTSSKTFSIRVKSAPPVALLGSAIITVESINSHSMTRLAFAVVFPVFGAALIFLMRLLAQRDEKKLETFVKEATDASNL